MNPQVGLALFIGLAATIEDIARRQISNWIPVTAFLGGLTLQVAEHGWHGGLTSLLGAVAGFGAFFLFYWLGGMGGGDIKLMAGFGALLGWGQLREAVLWTAGCGGILAVAYLLANEVRRAWRKWRGQPGAPERIETIPYAPAITLGAWLALVPKG